MNLGTYATLCTKINSKCEDPKVRAKTIKLLEGNSIHLNDRWLGNSSLDLIPKNTSNKRKNKLDLIKIKNLFVRGYYQKNEDNLQMGEIVSNHNIPNKDLVSRIYRGNLTKQKKKTTNKNGKRVSIPQRNGYFSIEREWIFPPQKV